MNLWGAAPLLAAAVLGSGVHSNVKPATVAASPVVQVGTPTWTTTVELSNTSRACPPKTDFTLETTGPSGMLPVRTESEVKQANGKAPPRCDEVSLAFAAPPQIPGSAVLEFYARGGTPAATPVTFSRPVSLCDYLAVPVGAGLVMAGLLLLSALIFVNICDWDGVPIPGLLRRDSTGKLTLRPTRPTRKFWRYTVLGSGAWSAGDSWATNIAPVVGILAGLFGVTTAASSLFPGIALDRFDVLNLVAAGIVAAAPFVFSILYARWTARNPGLTADSVIVPPVRTPAEYSGGWDFAVAGATVTAPAGATLTVPGGAIVGTFPEERMVEAAEAGATLKDGATLQLPPGSEIGIVPGRAVILPGGPDVIAAGPSALLITCQPGDRLVLPADQAAPAKHPRSGPHPAGQDATWADPGGGKGPAGNGNGAGQDGPAGTTLGSPAWVRAPAGARVSVAGTAAMLFPLGATVTAPRRRETRIDGARHLVLPQGGNTMVANMRLVILSALITMFGVGAQIGIACVLAYYSDATTFGLGVVLVLIGAVAAVTLYYSTTAIRALADPQPGSSLSAVSGTSFTL